MSRPLLLCEPLLDELLDVGMKRTRRKMRLMLACMGICGLIQIHSSPPIRNI